MNKKLLWAMALPAVLAGCSQDDLISEGISNNTPQGKAISGLTFTIAKNGSDAAVDTRAEWIDNKISFESGDLVSLFWLGADGLEQNEANDGEFAGELEELTDATAMTGKSNAVFRTEDGSNFSAEAVVYEGYNLLVYPGNTQHVNEQSIEVKLPDIQDASEDFTKHVVYIGDSILQIHEPALDAESGKYYDIYGEEAGTEDPNTAGYAHGIKTGVKLLTSLFEMNLRIINTSATDVKIQKVVLTTQDGTSGIYSNGGNLVPGSTSGIASANAVVPERTKYRNPWFNSNGEGNTASVEINCENIETNKNGTKVTMLLMPAYVGELDTKTEQQPVLKVYTNYGVVTIGGNNNDGTQSNCIFKKDGNTYAADNDDEALKEIVKATANTKAKLSVVSSNNEPATLTISSGAYIPRVINVDMQKAVIDGQHVTTTEELNAVLNAAVAGRVTYDEDTQLTINLDFDKKGNFELTDYEGLDAFVEKFGEGALSLVSGKCTDKTAVGVNLTNIIVNTTEETVLRNIEGLNSSITLTLPATTKINTIKQGKDKNYIISNPIINETEITLPNKAEFPLKNNAKGTIHYQNGGQWYNAGKGNIDATTIGVIDYNAESQEGLLDAMEKGRVNFITVEGVTSGFFSGGIDATSDDAWATSRGGITIVFDNCGDLSKTISTSETNAIKAETIVLTDGTTYSDLTNATVTNIIVETAEATLGCAGEEAKKMTGEITIKAGSKTTIDNLDLSAATLQVDAEATATIGEDAVAPENFYVLGTVSFAGSNGQTKETVYTRNEQGQISGINAINGNCVVTGSLELLNDLAYKKVAVSGTAAITVGEDVTGLGYTENIYVTRDEQANGTANLKYVETDDAVYSKYSWNGDFANLGW